MKLTPKNWDNFQHYKHRSPPWIKLHKNLLDDMAFQRLPVASKAIAPMLWLLASESQDGVIHRTPEEIAFRLRMTEKEVVSAIKPLIDNGFFIEDSSMLAERLQDATTEKSRVESEKSKRESKSKTPTPISDEFEISEPIKAWALKNGHSQLEKHLESFINKCKAKNYKYSDWDAAFRNAITDNWAKVGQAQMTQDKAYGRWDSTLASTMARGKELGILPKVGETEGQYRERLKQGGA
jgi:hypothetical protein